ncbi:MAG TPA: acyl-CoA dehydrogenase family protein, partial [Pseudonocardiaceae bacterium]|nr:acyl-CoA dehydrogenase family protein [Pseudonocardiaceae bacterium]
MDVTDAQPRTKLGRAATELVPLLKKNALNAEENRRIPDDTIGALADAGILKLRLPVRYGGYEADMTTVVDVVSELARGCGSTGWTTAVWTISAWMVGLFP